MIVSLNYQPYYPKPEDILEDLRNQEQLLKKGGGSLFTFTPPETDFFQTLEFIKKDLTDNLSKLYEVHIGNVRDQWQDVGWPIIGDSYLLAVKL